ncbi:MAG: hypothetical protein V4505_07155 [Pseudomonadota bacterium]
MKRLIGWLAAAAAALQLCACATAPSAAVGGTGADVGPAAADSHNMEIIGRSDLNGAGKAGEGMALKQYPDGRRVLFIAHESGPLCVTVLDVTRPRQPTVIVQVPAEDPALRCNSLGLSGDILAVAHETRQMNKPHGGMNVYDVHDPAKPVLLSYFDTTGRYSGGAHYVWFADGRYAYLTTGAADFEPKHPATHNYPDNDIQFMMIVDLQDPRHPKEVGRWWFPGARKGDPEPAPPREKIAAQDTGFRPHSIIVLPQRPDRAYVGWIDGGFVILDISDKAHPRLVSNRGWQSAGKGFAHTLLPLFDRGIAIQSEESVRDNCQDWPKRDWIWDIRNEKDPYPLAPLPPPKNLKELCAAGGRFGAHNINMNRPSATEKTLTKTVVGSFFNGGVRIYSIADPDHPEEIGYMVPKAPPGNATKTIQINDIYVDEKGIIYADDRLSGGLYVMQYTGSVPLE